MTYNDADIHVRLVYDLAKRMSVIVEFGEFVSAKPDAYQEKRQRGLISAL